jgi:hypothetical protein
MSPGESAGRARLIAIVADMQAASDAADEANGTSDYMARMVALALIARHFLREGAAEALAGQEEAPSEQQLHQQIDAATKRILNPPDALHLAAKAAEDSPEPPRSIEWGLANVYTIARRRLRKLPDGHPEREWWQHVVRIAEESGVKQPGVLRHSVPTEITDGSPAPRDPREEPR